MNRSLAMFLDELDRRDEERRIIKTLKHPQFEKDEEKKLEEKDMKKGDPSETT